MLNVCRAPCLSGLSCYIVSFDRIVINYSYYFKSSSLIEVNNVCKIILLS